MKKKSGIDWLGIGVVKCGTSWTWRELGKHPQLWTPQIKEVHYFNLSSKKTWEWYQNLFSIAPPTSLVGEWTPDYFNHPEARFIVKEYCPNTKMIVIFRNPTDRAFSNYKHALYAGRMKPKITFAKAFQNWRIRERGVYSTFLKKWWDIFPKKQIKIMLYDDLQKDNIKFIQTLYKWLGVDHTYLSQDYKRWFDFTYHYTKHNKIKMSKEDRKLYTKYYIPSITELEGMIERDLSEWKNWD